jgi:hypothetical protein
MGASVLLAQSSLGRPAMAEENVRQRYAGTFHFAGGERERAMLEHAIDDSVRDLSWLTRGIVRRRLTVRAGIAPWVTLSFPPGWIRIVVPGHPPALSPDSGAAVDYPFEGETLRMTQRFEGVRLVQVFRAREGSRVNEYVPDDRDATLVLHVTIESPRLARPLRYTLTYRR